MKSRTKFLNAAKAVLGVLSLAFAFNVTTFAQGYDLFQTGSGAYVDLSSMNIGLGQVNLQGVPIQSSTGNADTIMYRSGAVPSGGGNVPTSIYALYLQSTSPVTYKGQSADVYVTINNSGGHISNTVLPQPDDLSSTPSTGNLDVDTSSSTFSSSLTVYADVIFVTHGGSPTNSSQILGSSPSSSVSMSTSGSSYQTSAPANYPSAPCYPAGNFYPLPKHQGPHPVVRATTKSSSTTTGSGASEKSSALAVACPYNPLPVTYTSY